MPYTTAAPADTAKCVDRNAEEISAKILAAKAPTWKVALWWTLGIAAVVSIIAVIIVMISKKSSVGPAVDAVMQFSEDQIRQAEAAKKIEIARAEGVAEVKLDEIRAAMTIKDEHERLKRLVEI